MLANLERPTAAFKMDINEAFRFIGRDRAWLQKVGLGALFSLLSVVIVGGILVQGYLLTLAERVSRADPEPLPPWDDYGALLRRGGASFVVSLAYSLPLIVLMLGSFLIFVPLVIAGSAGGRAGGQAAGAGFLFLSLFWLLLIPVALLIGVVVPAAHAQLVLHDGEIGAAFRLREVAGFIGRYRGQYALMLLLTYVINGFLSQIGYLACFVGVFATIFIAQLFQYHLLGQLCWHDRAMRAGQRAT